MPHRVTYLGLYLLLLLCAPLLAQRDLSAPTDSKTVKAVKPAVQTDAWALSWWNKRHEEKLQQKESLGTVDLLMIGDSITHGWENKGATCGPNTMQIATL